MDGIVARTCSHALVEELARIASVPVINGLTDLLHPCQVMADLQTIAERADLSKAVIAYLPACRAMVPFARIRRPSPSARNPPRGSSATSSSVTYDGGWLHCTL